MIPVLDARQMRAADAAAIRAGASVSELMENAAAALLAEIEARFSDWRRVVVACGPGNNGGDGLAAARLLVRGGISVSVFSLNAPSEYRGAAAENRARAEASGLEVVSLAGRGGWERFREALGE
ncbi:MAG: NAD(P)H-hydrate epimerase, partial [Acidobacteriota bacterium]